MKQARVILLFSFQMQLKLVMCLVASCLVFGIDAGRNRRPGGGHGRGGNRQGGDQDKPKACPLEPMQTSSSEEVDGSPRLCGRDRFCNGTQLQVATGNDTFILTLCSSQTDFNFTAFQVRRVFKTIKIDSLKIIHIYRYLSEMY